MSETIVTPRIPATICKALVAAQRAAKAVTKDATNTWHNYKYASAEALIEEARGALGEAGLALVTVGWEWHPYTPPEAGFAEGEPTGRMVVHYALVHEGGEQLETQCSTPVIPERGRPDDKAEATSLTYNLGYYLRALLLLPRVNAAEDVDQRNDVDHRPARHSKRESARPKPSPALRNGKGQPVTPSLLDAQATLKSLVKRAKAETGETWDSIEKTWERKHGRTFSQSDEAEVRLMIADLRKEHEVRAVADAFVEDDGIRDDADGEAHAALTGLDGH